jgi:hypothetical protein
MENKQLDFHLTIEDNVLTFKIHCTDSDVVERAFYEALTDEKILKQDRHALLLAISDALIAVMEEEQDYAAAHHTLEKFIELYNSSTK